MSTLKLNPDSRKTNQTSRIPVNGTSGGLQVEGKDPNFVYYVVNDTPGRVDKFRKGGYEVVTDETVSFAGSTGKDGSVVSTPVGQGTTGVLMKIKKEWYDEDQENAQARIRETEQLMHRNLNNKSEADYGKFGIEE